MIDLFDELASVTAALRAAEIPHALVGGLAYSVLVEVRGTEDIDLLVNANDWEKIQETLRPLGYLALSAPMDFPGIRIRRLTKIESGDVIVVDFLFADDELRTGIDQCMDIPHGDQVIPVAPPRIIIAMKKRRLSKRDEADIEGLERLEEES